jgi:uncharacterized damage-inducible protein DinB
MNSLFLLTALALLAPALTDAERQAAADQFTSSRQKLIVATEGLTEAQWQFAVGEGRWSIAAVMEHLALTEAAIPNLIQFQLLKTPATEKANPERDASIRAKLLDRTGKAQAPEMLKPTGKFPNGPAARHAFLSARAKNITYLNSTPDDLRHHVMPHMALGPLDGYQWLLFVSGHTERHIAQMEEIKTSPGYPRP